MKPTFQNQPFLLDKPTGNSYSDGFKLNIYERSGGFSTIKGNRVCQIPAFTWRSEQAVIELGTRIAAIPVTEEALMIIAKSKIAGTIGAIHAQQTAIEALKVAGLWTEEVRS